MLDTLLALRALLKDEPVILASAEDTAYFRNRATKQSAPPPVPIPKAIPKLEKKEEPPPLPPAPLEEAPKEIPPKTPAPPPPRSTTLFHSILAKVAPNLAIIDKIPDDKTAKQIASRWKTLNQSAPISILTSGELPEHRALLEEIGIALDVYFGPAKLIEADSIEKEKQWKTFLSSEGLKLIVICDSTLWQLSTLRQFYTETPAAGTRELSGVPIFLLPDLSLYLKDPALKRSLWKALCSKCS
jgi:hypothetical protein